MLLNRSPHISAYMVLCGASVALAAALALAPTLAQAQNYKDVAPQPVPAPPPKAAPAPPLPTDVPTGPAATRTIIPAVKALVFVPGVQNVVKKGAVGKGVEIKDLPLLDDPAFLAAVTPFIGQKLTLARITEITREVVKQYRAKDHPLVDVIVPEQDVNNGVVQLAVVEFTVGKVRAEGNRWFSSEVLVGKVHLKPGEPVVGSRLLVDQALLNDSPYRSVEILYERGGGAGQTDVVLKTTDRLPVRVYGGYDDQGTKSVGMYRYSAGFGYGNVFGLDHQLGFQVTSSADLLSGNPDLPGRQHDPRFLSESWNYTAPLPWDDKITFFGLHAESVPRLANTFNQVGLTDQISARYIKRLPVWENFTEEAQFGFDFKRTNNNLAFGGLQINNTSTEVDQFVGQYSATYVDPWGSTSLTADGYYSPGKITRNNNDAAFQTSRAGARAEYLYGQVVGERLTPIPKFGLLPEGFIWSVKATVQDANRALLPSEELSLGGESSLRGYDPYLIQGDKGWIVSNELRAPAFSITALTRGDNPWNDRIQFFVFHDIGRVWSLVPQPNEFASTTLASGGAGFHYTIDRYVDLRFDWGWQLTHIRFDPHPLGQRGDLSLTVAF
ncbi:MAG: ShlB/FhaC/HecB family hemolysin secretion/activation protein [Hyphomicrobiales bacterium]|nr:ShlB/FhaC/HecB family hemolysin secretion/activation protein [Hyphomicrobiales bacterium]